ncbi:hypothetical protein OS242_20790, partial [Tumebacillus sp. DT12]
GTPPAFVLSQDQTLNKSLVHSELNRWLENRSRNTRLVFKDQSGKTCRSSATFIRLTHILWLVNRFVSFLHQRRQDLSYHLPHAYSTGFPKQTQTKTKKTPDLSGALS